MSAPPVEDGPAEAPAVDGGVVEVRGRPPLRERLRARRGTVLVVVLVLVTVVVLALSSVRGEGGLLLPDGTDGSGSAALAALLREQGVRVDVARTAEEAAAARPGSTLLVARPDRLARLDLAVVAHSSADVVLVAPDPDVLGALVPAVVRARPDGATSGLTGAPAEPGCALRAAVRAGPVDLGGDTYRALTEPSVRCYVRGGVAALVVRPVGAHTVTVVGDTAPFTNAALGDGGDAALTLGLLGARPRLVWYVPTPTADPAGGPSLGDLLPAGWVWGAVELAVAALALALGRARRFGAVVTERLPVVVRATETTEGRARLYRRTGARGRAATALRADARRTVTGRLGLPRAAPPAAVVAAVAARTGRGPGEVGALLDGAVPADDAALVRLATDLDTLVAAATGTTHPTGGAG